MQFTANPDESKERIWELIIETIGPEKASIVCSSSSSFYKTSDGIECSLRKINGELIGNCYSESDRMGKRRWSINFF